MDPGVLGPLIPIVAILAFAGIRVAKILAPSRSQTLDARAGERLDALEDEVGILRRELEEANERLDFTERLLAQHRPDRLGPPS
ncbi:MAG: hypothetical protein OEW44_01615 [Gemmatimonadota bacterium]|jgi:hypothetical protein|nr:hypothetical protein [Gemmatimonadota bacterium]